MRADEAMKASKDKVILFGNKNAAALCGKNLYWLPLAAFRLVEMEFICIDNWQPSKPVELCEACHEADRLKSSISPIDIMVVVHLRNFHCTCKKEA